MAVYSKPVWKLAKEALAKLGGDTNWIQLREIVKKVQEDHPDDHVNEHTIRCQVRGRCVNGHPSHDGFPDKGKMWREQPTFVSNKSGKYRIYNKKRDYAIYLASLAQDGISIEPITTIEEIKIALTTPYENHPMETSKHYMPINNPIVILEKLGSQLGFQTQREWPVSMGRIDLVWYKEIPFVIPQTTINKIPLVGFEIETSWRTRKHIKGDIQNLQALKSPLGIVLQLTSSKDYPNEVSNLIHNVRDFLREQGLSNIVIWTEEDLTILNEAVNISREN